MNVLITGGSKGIGLAVAKLFEKDKVIITSRHKAKHLGLDSQIADVTKEEDVKQLVKYVREKYKKIDVLIMNAGIGLFKEVENFSESDYDAIMNTNVKGLFLMMKHFKKLLSKNAQIITISSMAANAQFPSGSIYCASKAAALSFTNNIKTELRDTNIKVCIVMPGSVDTDFFKSSGIKPNKERILTPKDVAKTIHYIANQPKTSDIDQVIIRPAKK